MPLRPARLYGRRIRLTSCGNADQANNFALFDGAQVRAGAWPALAIKRQAACDSGPGPFAGRPWAKCCCCSNLAKDKLPIERPGGMPKSIMRTQARRPGWGRLSLGGRAPDGAGSARRCKSGNRLMRAVDR